jgi:hypothetical protein
MEGSAGRGVLWRGSPGVVTLDGVPWRRSPGWCPGVVLQMDSSGWSPLEEVTFGGPRRVRRRGLGECSPGGFVWRMSPGGVTWRGSRVGTISWAGHGKGWAWAGLAWALAGLVMGRAGHVLCMVGLVLDWAVNIFHWEWAGQQHGHGLDMVWTYSGYGLGWACTGLGMDGMGYAGHRMGLGLAGLGTG